MPRKALGRGLDALIPGNTATAVADAPESMRDLPLHQISPNPHQPRTRFDDEAIRELAASIKSTGVLQPILVRKVANGFEVIAGERRLRAAGLAGLEKIPAIIKEVDDRAMLETALIENVQRENLNPIEEAKAYRALVEEVQLTQDQVAERVGKQRVSISNTLRLLALPAEVQDMVSRGTLSAGHARALLGLESAADQLGAARYVHAKGFSVRRTEAYVRRRLRRQHARPASSRSGPLAEWEVKLQQRFGTHVSITARRKGGEVKFEYYGQEDLERLLEAWGLLS